MTLNYQTIDDQNAYNHARFSDNGGCGYVLKPEFLRDPSIAYSSIGGSCGLNKKYYPLLKMNISIISAYFLTKSGEYDNNLYVEFGIKGHETDKREFKTESISNNGSLNYVWNEKFTFECKVPELAFLQFEVKQSGLVRDETLGFFCIPLNSILEGMCCLYYYLLTYFFVIWLYHTQHYCRLTIKCVCISAPIIPSMLLGPASSLLAG